MTHSLYSFIFLLLDRLLFLADLYLHITKICFLLSVSDTLTDALITATIRDFLRALRKVSFNIVIVLKRRYGLGFCR